MIKRARDALVALVALIVLAPLLLLVSLLVRLQLGSPVLFRQQRLGYLARSFVLLKFRTMVEAQGPNGASLADEDRLTSFGRWLRRTSLDELPQLWNVLSGDMSLVGPRPLLPEYLPLYSPDQRRRHEVLPGITGWAQVMGRNALSWNEKFALDVWYVDHQSILLDAKILVLTVLRVVRREGISSGGEATMPRFTGSDA